MVRILRIDCTLLSSIVFEDVKNSCTIDNTTNFSYQNGKIFIPLKSIFQCFPKSYPVAKMINAGTVLMWRYPANKLQPTDEDWKALPKVPIGPTIRTLSWGGGNRYLAINCVRQVFVLTEQELAVGYCDGVSAIQQTPSQVLVKFHGNKSTSLSTEVTSKLELQIQGKIYPVSQ